MGRGQLPIVVPDDRPRVLITDIRNYIEVRSPELEFSLPIDDRRQRSGNQKRTLGMTLHGQSSRQRRNAIVLALLYTANTERLSSESSSPNPSHRPISCPQRYRMKISANSTLLIDTDATCRRFLRCNPAVSAVVSSAIRIDSSIDLKVVTVSFTSVTGYSGGIFFIIISFGMLLFLNFFL